MYVWYLIVKYIFYVSADIFDKVDEEIKAHAGLRANCVGGGRIEHDPDEKTIKVYGYSQVSAHLHASKCSHAQFTGILALIIFIRY